MDIAVSFSPHLAQQMEPARCARDAGFPRLSGSSGRAECPKTAFVVRFLDKLLVSH